MLRWVKHNQLLAFMATCFLLSWIIWALTPIVCPGNVDAQRVLNTIGAFGPSAAAVIIALLLGESPVKGTVNFKAFILSFLIILPLTLLSLELVFMAQYNLINILLFVLASMIAALIIAMAFSRNSAATMLSSLVNLKVSLRWYAFALLLFPAAVILGAVLDSYLADIKLSFYSGSFVQYAYLLIMTFIGYGLFGGSLNEEIGWRGFAMPRLLKRFNPFVATLILGVVWTVWHGPLHFNGFYGNGLVGFINRYPMNIALTFFFTHLYLKTKGSILLAVLLHTSVNFSFAMFPITTNSMNYASGLLLVFLIITLIYDRKLWFPARSKEASRELTS